MEEPDEEDEEAICPDSVSEISEDDDVAYVNALTSSHSMFVFVVLFCFYFIRDHAVFNATDITVVTEETNMMKNHCVFRKKCQNNLIKIQRIL